MTNSFNKSYKDLRIWQNGIDIVKSTYKLTNKLPKSEQFGLISQMRRASVSIPSNIAEGYRRGTKKEFAHFLFQSLGSVAELETQSYLVEDLFQLNSAALTQLTSNIQPQIMKLISKLKE